MKDEALSPVAFLMEKLPIAKPTDEIRADVEAVVQRLVAIASEHQSTRRDLLDWLHVQYEIDKPSNRLQNPISLDSDAFVAEIQKGRGKKKMLTAAGLRNLRDEHARTLGPARMLADEARALEGRLHDLVNAAYGLSPDEVRLLWDTAPPRMPIPRPGSV